MQCQKLGTRRLSSDSDVDAQVTELGCAPLDHSRPQIRAQRGQVLLHKTLLSLALGCLDVFLGVEDILGRVVVRAAMSNVCVCICAAVLQAVGAEVARAAAALESAAGVEVEEGGVAPGAPEGQQLLGDVTEGALHFTSGFIHLGQPFHLLLDRFLLLLLQLARELLLGDFQPGLQVQLQSETGDVLGQQLVGKGVALALAVLVLGGWAYDPGLPLLETAHVVLALRFHVIRKVRTAQEVLLGAIAFNPCFEIEDKFIFVYTLLLHVGAVLLLRGCVLGCHELWVLDLHSVFTCFELVLLEADLALPHFGCELEHRELEQGCCCVPLVQWAKQPLQEGSLIWSQTLRFAHVLRAFEPAI